MLPFNIIWKMQLRFRLLRLHLTTFERPSGRGSLQLISVIVCGVLERC